MLHLKLKKLNKHHGEIWKYGIFVSNGVIISRQSYKFGNFLNFLKESIKLYPCRKFHADMSFYSRDTVDGSCDLYIYVQCLFGQLIGLRMMTLLIYHLPPPIIYLSKKPSHISVKGSVKH